MGNMKTGLVGIFWVNPDFPGTGFFPRHDFKGEGDS
jgi:hypothetical protein